jgi:K+-sensing histidine kinase KdpD
MKRNLSLLAAALGSIATVTFVYTRMLQVTNSTIVALTFLLIVLVVAATSRLWLAVTTSMAAMLAFNFFFLPPVGTLTIAEPQNWVALFTFLAVSLIASNLSSTVRAREREAAERRKAADLARQGEELKSALLASLGHDLRTPLTAIRVAASNLQASWLTPDERFEQSAIVLAEVERLTRLFQNILDMARIEAGGVSAADRWVHPSEIVSAARDLVPQALRNHVVEVAIKADRLVKVDPRLTAAALSHLLENAAQYSPPATPIEVVADVSAEGVMFTVRDHGPGVPIADLPHLFERFYRGGYGRKRLAGTGMGLSIARGLIAVEHGRVWAENCEDGGAKFTIVVSADSKPLDVELAEA